MDEKKGGRHMLLRAISLLITCYFLAAPKVQAELIIPNPKFSFGEVEEGFIVEHVFEIRNNSPDPIEILHVKPDCGCTVAEHSKRIEAGKTGYVKLVFNTKGYKGHVTKSAIVETSPKQTKEIVLVLEGKIKVPIDVSSSNVLFYGPDVKGQKKVITIRAEKSKDLELTVLRDTLKEKVNYVLKEVEKGRVYQLEIECLQGPEANFFGEIILKTNYDEAPEIKILVRKIPFKK